MQLQSRRTDLGDSLEPIAIPPGNRYRPLYPDYAETQNPILHYLRFLRKHRWAILATVGIVFALSVIATLKTTRLYQATSKVAIFPENPNVLGFKGLDETSPVDYQYDVALETQAAILRSDAIALKVIQAMHLDQDSRFTGGNRSSLVSGGAIRTADMEPDPTKTAGLLGALTSGLSVQLIPSSRLIQVSFTHPDPRLATEVVNTLVRTFIEENFKTKYESVTQTSDWLSKELADLQLRVQTSEEKLVRYQKDHSILGIDEKQNIVTAKLDELNKELTAAQTDRIQKESNYKLAMAGDPTAFVKATGERTSSLLENLQEKEADLNTQRAQAMTQFGSGYPKVGELNNQLKQVVAEIAAEKLRMRSRLRDEYLGASERERLLTSAFDEQKKQANQLNENSIEYSVLKRDAESNRQLYQSLLQRLKEAGVTAGLKSSNIRVVDIARIPTYPIKPSIPRNLALGLLLGLAGGIGLAFVLESLDRSVRDMEQVTAISTLPALGTIPLQLSTNGDLRKRLNAVSIGAEKADSLALVTYSRPKSEAAEAYRALRTSILLSAFGTPPKVILVTSPLPQEGKTTISANSALVLAQRGSRVLLIDADLRRPGLERMLGIKSKGGLSTLISGVDKEEDVVVPFSKVPNLWILPAGPIPPQPAELLGSNIMKEHLARWRDEFDHVIIDTPPCLSVTDAVVLSPDVDRVLLVARSGQTTKLALRRSCDLLIQVNARVMGVVLNAFDLRSADSYYYYGARSGGSYYDESTSNNGNSVDSKVS